MNSNSSLRVSMIQAPIVWEDRTENVAYYGKLLHGLTGKTDLAVLPELFTTGLSMRARPVGAGRRQDDRFGEAVGPRIRLCRDRELYRFGRRAFL